MAFRSSSGVTGHAEGAKTPSPDKRTAFAHKTAKTPLARISNLSLARPAANEQGKDGPDDARIRLMEAVCSPLPVELPFRQAREAFERAYFERFLARESGSRSRVAEKSGLDRAHLYRKLKALGIKAG